jgi:Tfp pilus assembly protein PilO
MTGRARMIIAGVAALLVCVAFFFFFIRPRQGELADVKDEVAAEEAQTLQLQAELARLQDLQARAPELEAELAKIRQLVPQTHQIPDFIFQVQDAANQSGVNFVSITPELPKPPPEGAAVAEVRMSIAAGGGYFAVQDFIRRLYDLDRAVRIDNLGLTGNENAQTGQIEISFAGAVRMFFEIPGAAAPPTTGTTTPVESPAPSPSG